MRALRYTFVVMCLGAIGLPTKARAQPAAKRLWLRVYSGARIAEAQKVRRLLSPEAIRGGRLRQAFVRRARGARSTTVFEVLVGPFASSMDAVVYGLSLRSDKRFVKAGLRLRSLAVLLPESFLPLPLRIDSQSVQRLNPGGKKPYPALADLQLARAIGFSLPSHALPAIEKATARFQPFRPLLVLGERTVCNAKRTACLRWFEVLQPVLIRTAWLPAYQLVLHKKLRKAKFRSGKGFTNARYAFWPIGRTKAGRAFRAMFRRGSLPPQLHTLVLADKNKPPYRLVVDKHGPGIYNADGNVVLRIKLRRWIYKRPPLWVVPKSLRRRRRRRRARPRPGSMTRPRPATMRPTMRRPRRAPMRRPRRARRRGMGGMGRR